MKNERREEYEATLLRRIEQIEALSMLIPDVTMLCPICSKYSVISFEYHTSLSSADLHSCTQLPPATEGEYFSRLVDMYGRRLSRPLRKLCMHDSFSLSLSVCGALCARDSAYTPGLAQEPGMRGLPTRRGRRL